MYRYGCAMKWEITIMTLSLILNQNYYIAFGSTWTITAPFGSIYTQFLVWQH